MLAKKGLLTFGLLISIFAWAQDEEKPPPLLAPHQGHVEVSGPYKVELLLEKDGILKVYLLDAELKNETVKNSEVDVFVKSGNTESEMTCAAVEATHFECKQSGGKKVKKGEFLISSKRDNIRTEELKVPFPFDGAAEKAPAKKRK